MDIVPYNAFDQQPDWLKELERVVGWLPWISVLIVLLFRCIKGRHVRAGFYLLGTATPLVLMIGWILFGPVITNCVHQQKFNAEAWKTQEQVDHDPVWPPRLCMVDDLMSGGQLDGLSSNQVITLLGLPHDKGFPGGAKSCDIHYYLGPERGLIRIDSEWLFISLNADGNVQKYWLYRD
jgi:hypothetical protein